MVSEENINYTLFALESIVAYYIWCTSFYGTKDFKKKKIPQDYHVRNTVRPNLAGGQHRCIHARERFSQFIVAIMIQEPFDSGLFSI